MNGGAKKVMGMFSGLGSVTFCFLLCLPVSTGKNIGWENGDKIPDKLYPDFIHCDVIPDTKFFCKKVLKLFFHFSKRNKYARTLKFL